MNDRAHVLSFYGCKKIHSVRDQDDPEVHVLDQRREVGILLDDIRVKHDHPCTDLAGDSMSVPDHASRQHFHETCRQGFAVELGGRSGEGFSAVEN